MASKLVEIAEAVKVFLNDESEKGTFAPYTFEATRTYLPWKQINELLELTVMVIPGGLSSEQESRSMYRDDLVVDVAIGKHIDITSNTEADAIMGLAELVHVTLRAIDVSDVSWVKNELKAIYDEMILLKSHVYLTVIRMTFNAAS
jgi:hypothetical protein